MHRLLVQKKNFFFFNLSIHTNFERPKKIFFANITAFQTALV